eukprot:243268_1
MSSRSIDKFLMWMLLLINIATTYAYAFHPLDYNSWVTGISSLPRASSRMAVAYGNITDTIWLLGGDYQQQLVEYQRENDIFIDHGVSVFSQNIHGFGQYYSQMYQHLYIIFNSSIHRFNTYNHSMDYNYYTTPMSVGTTSCLCILNIDNGYLITNGGFNQDGNNSVATVQILNISSNQWISNVSSLHEPRAEHSCNTFNESIFVIGGYNYNNESNYSDEGGWLYLNTVEVINIYNYENQWTLLKDKLSARMSNHRSILYNNEIVVFGGYDASIVGPPYDGSINSMHSINVINAITHKIYPITSFLNIAAYNIVPINVAGIIYLFGGYSNGSLLSSWRYCSPNSFSPTLNPSANPILNHNPTLITLYYIIEIHSDIVLNKEILNTLNETVLIALQLDDYNITIISTVIDYTYMNSVQISISITSASNHALDVDIIQNQIEEQLEKEGFNDIDVMVEEIDYNKEEDSIPTETASIYMPIIIISVSVVCALMIGIGVIFCCCLYWKKKKMRHTKNDVQMTNNLADSTAVVKDDRHSDTDELYINSKTNDHNVIITDKSNELNERDDDNDIEEFYVVRNTTKGDEIDKMNELSEDEVEKLYSNTKGNNTITTKGNNTITTKGDTETDAVTID